MSALVADELAKARVAIAEFAEISLESESNGVLTFEFDGIQSILQGLEIADGLIVLQLTSIVAWDVPENGHDLVEYVATRAESGMFGSLNLSRAEDGTNDLTVRYAFPSAGLSTAAVRTLLMLVLGQAVVARKGLPL
jgi:hypothetical protein